MVWRYHVHIWAFKELLTVVCGRSRSWWQLCRFREHVSGTECRSRLARCSGVVQLFNAVRQQQGEVQSRLQEAGGSLRRTETALQAVSRHSFLQRLRDGADAESPPPQQVSRRPPATAGYRTGRSKLAAGALQDTGQIGSALTRSRHRTHKCCLGIKIVDTQMFFFYLPGIIEPSA